MSLPPPLPEPSFFDGGDPQSQVAPGDTGRELLHEVKNLNQAVVLLAKTTARRKETNSRRRWGFWALALLVFVTIFIHDEHTERCGPGSRAETAVRALVDADPADPVVRDDIIAAVRGEGQSKVCDLTFPLHDHDDNGWPQSFNVLGLLGFLAIFGGSAFYIYRLNRGDREHEKQVKRETTINPPPPPLPVEVAKEG